jgi:hypothetical protein
MRMNHTPTTRRANRAAAMLGAAAAAAALMLAVSPASAHHGSSISYDTANQWTTWATIVEFNYLNPHPTMKFDRVVKNDVVEHWVAEMLTNPSTMARAGWTRQRTIDALAPGTRVKLVLATSRAGGFSGIVVKIEDEAGEAIGGRGRPGSDGVDLDGVPGGLQPKHHEPLPGQPSAGTASTADQQGR